MTTRVREIMKRQAGTRFPRPQAKNSSGKPGLDKEGYNYINCGITMNGVCTDLFFYLKISSRYHFSNPSAIFQPRFLISSTTDRCCVSVNPSSGKAKEVRASKIEL
jgi:hypothetical protein